MEQAQSVLGYAVLMLIAWGLSENRQLVSGRLVAVGIALQVVLVLLFFNLGIFTTFFALLNQVVTGLQSATEAGSSFVFGYLGGAPLPFEETRTGAAFILAFRALPLVILISALSALLHYWRILPWVVRGFAWALTRLMGVSGAVGLGTAANIFVGMVEAPLLVKHYVGRMNRSELFMLMTAGMATIAGTMLVLYATVIAPVIPDSLGHLLAASVISAPAALTVAHLMLPAAGTTNDQEVEIAQTADSSMDALTQGTLDGLRLYLNILAMLLVFVALVYLVNAGLNLFPEMGGQPISLERILGYLMAPVAWLMGVPWVEAVTAGSLMGVKTILNEFLAYIQMSALEPGTLSDRSELIMTYAMCGFANFGSLGIMLGGLSTIAPERRSEIVGLGLRTIVSGTIATCCTGALVGMFTAA